MAALNLEAANSSPNMISRRRKKCYGQRVWGNPHGSDIYASIKNMSCLYTHTPSSSSSIRERERENIYIYILCAHLIGWWMPWNNFIFPSTGWCFPWVPATRGTHPQPFAPLFVSTPDTTLQMPTAPEFAQLGSPAGTSKTMLPGSDKPEPQRAKSWWWITRCRCQAGHESYSGQYVNTHRFPSSSLNHVTTPGFPYEPPTALRTLSHLVLPSLLINRCPLVSIPQIGLITYCATCLTSRGMREKVAASNKHCAVASWQVQPTALQEPYISPISRDCWPVYSLTFPW